MRKELTAGERVGGFVAVDWGSTARRAYAVDAAGHVVDEMEDDAGALVTPRERFPAEVAALRARFGSAPMLMAGMVGSNRGWVEAPYVPCPAALADVAAHLFWAAPGQVAIVPGLSLVEGDRADVMRGEEVQVFGAAALGLPEGEALICHPGTHTKWVTFAGDRLARFSTVMTGELFALLKAHSILAELLAGTVEPGAAFLTGVERGWRAASIAAELFAVRAGVILGTVEHASAASLISGLLIGNDLNAGLAGVDAGREVVVIGRGSLTRLYAAALAARGHPTREIDGAEAFVAGIRALKEIAA